MKLAKQWMQFFQHASRRQKARKSLKGEEGNTHAGQGILCLQPFHFMEFTTYGEVYTCCPAWIKFSIGNMKNNTIGEIWNSERARYVRRKMYLGEWQDICNPICPRVSVYKRDKTFIPYDYLENFDFLTPGLVDEIKNKKDYLSSSPTVFNLSNSRVCNLSCIMCDRESQTDDHELIKKTAQDVLNYLPTARKLVLTGVGDPFARPDTRSLLIDFNGRDSDLRFDLMTNALLLPRYWEQIKHQNFGSILISIDAATKEIYEKIRVGGAWDTLLRSLALVKENRNRFSSVTLNMTVMKSNYRSIPEFIDFTESYGFNASFQRIRGIIGDENFFEMEDEHSLNGLKKILSDEHFEKRGMNIFLGDLLEFYE
jgi:MoaA/NifB/PqqE/SkfB family radical SAM enzyme